MKLAAGRRKPANNLCQILMEREDDYLAVVEKADAETCSYKQAAWT